MKEIITSKKNPIPAGPFSQAIKVGDVCYTSGQLPYDKEKDAFELEDMAHATQMCLDAIENICEELGVTKSDIIKCTIFVNDITKYGLVNEVYGNFFDADYPARTAYEVANLPFGVPVEIEALIDCGSKA